MRNIQHQPEQHRFALMKDNEEIGYIEYRQNNGGWEITETRIMPDFRGQSLARLLVDYVISEADRQGLAISASCDYAEEVLARSGRG